MAPQAPEAHAFSQPSLISNRHMIPCLETHCATTYNSVSSPIILNLLKNLYHKDECFLIDGDKHAWIRPTYRFKQDCVSGTLQNLPH
eukprot:1136811-Pelagomonas_calceolata.AAC.2